MLRAARLTWRLYRFELAVALVASIGMAAAAWAAAVHLRNIAPSAECLSAHWSLPPDVRPPDCPGLAEFLEFSREVGDKILGLMTALPVVLGVVLGSQIVSREVDEGTAPLIWGLAPSRWRWLLLRVFPLTVLLIGVLTLAGFAGSSLLAAQWPWLDPVVSFKDYGLRGPIVPARGLAIFAVALLLGGLTGRRLPAVIVSLVAAIALLISLTLAFPFGQPTEALPPEVTEDFMGFDVVAGPGFEMQDGTLLSVDEAIALAPDPSAEDDADAWARERFRFVLIGIARQRVADVELREAALLAGTTITGLLMSILVIERRRPE